MLVASAAQRKGMHLVRAADSILVAAARFPAGPHLSWVMGPQGTSAGIGPWRSELRGWGSCGRRPCAEKGDRSGIGRLGAAFRLSGVPITCATAPGITGTPLPTAVSSCVFLASRGFWFAVEAVQLCPLGGPSSALSRRGIGPRGWNRRPTAIGDCGGCRERRHRGCETGSVGWRLACPDQAHGRARSPWPRENRTRKADTCVRNMCASSCTRCCLRRR